MPLLFSVEILHATIDAIPVSAGFAIIDYDSTIDQFKVKCFGDSSSLQKEMNAHDCFIIQDYLNNLLCNSDSETITTTIGDNIVFK